MATYKYGFPIDNNEGTDPVLNENFNTNTAKFLVSNVDLMTAGTYEMGTVSDYQGLTFTPRTLFLRLTHTTGAAIPLGTVALEFESVPGTWVKIGERSVAGLKEVGDIVCELMGQNALSKSVPAGKKLRLNVTAPVKGVTGKYIVKAYLAGIYF